MAHKWGGTTIPEDPPQFAVPPGPSPVLFGFEKEGGKKVERREWWAIAALGMLLFSHFLSSPSPFFLFTCSECEEDVAYYCIFMQWPETGGGALKLLEAGGARRAFSAPPRVPIRLGPLLERSLLRTQWSIFSFLPGHECFQCLP